MDIYSVNYWHLAGSKHTNAHSLLTKTLTLARKQVSNSEIPLILPAQQQQPLILEAGSESGYGLYLLAPLIPNSTTRAATGITVSCISIFTLLYIPLFPLLYPSFCHCYIPLFPLLYLSFPIMIYPYSPLLHQITPFPHLYPPPFYYCRNYVLLSSC